MPEQRLNESNVERWGKEASTSLGRFAAAALGLAAMRSYIEEKPEVIKAFGRAFVRSVKFGMDPANQDAVLEHAAAGNPQEGEDPAFAAALLEAVKGRIAPADPEHGWAYQPPEHRELWHRSQIDSGALSEPLPNLEDAYMNRFVAAWNADAPQ